MLLVTAHASYILTRPDTVTVLLEYINLFSTGNKCLGGAAYSLEIYNVIFILILAIRAN